MNEWVNELNIYLSWEMKSKNCKNEIIKTVLKVNFNAEAATE